MEKEPEEGIILSKTNISIIIPVYNTEQYLDDCLKSCVIQTLPDVEFIIVNDGSSDASQEIIDSYSGSDSRFISITQEHKGVSQSRNRGLACAKGELVMFLDSDDYLNPSSCEVIWKEYLTNSPDIIIYKTNIIADNPALIPSWLKRNLTSIDRKKYKPFMSDALFNEPAAKPFIWRDVFRKSIIDSYQLRFNEDLVLAEDLVFQLKAFPHASCISYIPDELYNYRRGRSGSATSEMTNLGDKVSQHLIACRYIIDYWHKQGWIQLYSTQFIPWIYNFVMRDIIIEKPEYALEHLIEVFRFTRNYQLEQYIEMLSPKVYKCFMSIGETVDNLSHVKFFTLKFLEFQMKVLQLQIKDEVSHKRVRNLQNYYTEQVRKRKSLRLYLYLMIENIILRIFRFFKKAKHE